jgi:mRNA export factor
VLSFSTWRFYALFRNNQFQRLNQPITATAFNASGSIFAYAVGYDWSKGVEYNDPNQRKYVLLHGVQDSEIKGKKANKNGRR